MKLCACGNALVAGCEMCEACFQKEMTRRMNLPHEKCCQRIAALEAKLKAAEKAADAEFAANAELNERLEAAEEVIEIAKGYSCEYVDFINALAKYEQGKV